MKWMRATMTNLLLPWDDMATSSKRRVAMGTLHNVHWITDIDGRCGIFIKSTSSFDSVTPTISLNGIDQQYNTTVSIFQAFPDKKYAVGRGNAQFYSAAFYYERIISWFLCCFVGNYPVAWRVIYCQKTNARTYWFVGFENVHCVIWTACTVGDDTFECLYLVGC